MAQPTPGDVHVNAPLTNVSIAYLQKRSAFIADKMFPNLPVMKQSDRYYSYPKGNWFRTEARVRAPGSESAGSGWTVDNTPNYFAPVVAVHKDVDDQIRANADAAIDVDRDAAEWVTQQLLLKRDLDFKSKYFGAGIWSADVTPAVLWDAAGSTPIDDLSAQIQAIQSTTGFKPNKLLLGAPVWYVLKNHPDFLDRIKYTQRAVVGLDLLAQVLELDEILVGEAVQNTAIEGAADAMSFVYGKHALLCYAAPAPSLLQPSAGYTFSWTGYLGAGPAGNRVKRFRMEPLSSDRIEGEMAYDMKLVASDLGVFFNGAIT